MRPAPARRKALAYLARLIEQTRRAGGVRLPTIHQMAAQAGLAHVTVSAAVRQLVAQGRLVARHRSGITITAHSHVTPPPQSAPADSGAGPLHVRVARRIERDIYRGDLLRVGMLADRKNLRSVYQVCGATLRKALAHLASTGIIVERGRNFVLASGNTPGGRDRILVLSTGFSPGVVRLFFERSQVLLGALQSACLERTLDLDLCACDPDGRVLSTHLGATSLRARASDPRTLGVVIWRSYLSAQVVSGICSRLSGCGRPVAILDDHELNPAIIALQNPSLRVFSTGVSPAPGEHMARYLLGRGWRRFVYVDAPPDEQWARNRLAGFASALERAGFADQLTVLQPASRSRRGGSSLETLARSQLAQLERWFRGRPRNRVTTLNYHSAHGALARAVSQEHLLEQTAPLLQKLTDRGAAVVGANDLIAIQALGHLLTSPRACPAVCGFDNSYDSLAMGLTSYSFDPEAVMHAMVSFMLEPRSARRLALGAHGAIELPGRVIERFSSRSPSA